MASNNFQRNARAAPVARTPSTSRNYHSVETGSVSEPVAVPVEEDHPLGRDVTLLSATALNIGRILGAGIFSTPGAVLSSVGSVGMLLSLWIITPLFPLSGLSVYTEFASMSPERSGAEVVYLEQAYPKPHLFVPTIFAMIPLIGTFSASNAIVCAQYVLTGMGTPVTPKAQTSLAVLALILTSGIVMLSTRWSLRAIKFFTILQVGSLLMITISGVAVFCGLTRVHDPYANFRQPFKGTSWNLNRLSTAFIKSSHSYIGWNNAFNVLGEVRSRDPVSTVRKATLTSLLLVSLLFLFANISYVAAVSHEDMKNSGQLIAALYFRRVFGPTGSRMLPFVIASVCFGNLIAATLGQARLIREVARQGLLPYPQLFASTKPFGTPMGPVLLRMVLNILLLIALPAKDAFNFVLDLASYPTMIFSAAMAIGLWRLRKRLTSHGLPLPDHRFRAANWAITTYLTFCVLTVVWPWVPPGSGHADVSFWYATYLVAGIVLVLCCCLYYWVWIVVLPKTFGYELAEKVEVESDGSKTRKLVRRYKRARIEHAGEEGPLLN